MAKVMLPRLLVLCSIIALLVISNSSKDVEAFSANKSNNIFSQMLNNILDTASPTSNKNDASSLRRNQLKEELFIECRNTGISEKEKRAAVEDIMDELMTLSPSSNDDTTFNRLLQKEWLLRYTTEKEINFFLDFGISNRVTQTIDGSLLTNNIEFKSDNGGYFGVKGRLSPLDVNDDGEKIRTNFEFETATLDIGKWGTYNFPPVGKGWFDTIYLDDNLRVDYNSRNDILICTPAEEE